MAIHQAWERVRIYPRGGAPDSRVTEGAQGRRTKRPTQGSGLVRGFTNCFRKIRAIKTVGGGWWARSIQKEKGTREQLRAGALGGPELTIKKTCTENVKKTGRNWWCVPGDRGEASYLRIVGGDQPDADPLETTERRSLRGNGSRRRFPEEGDVTETPRTTHEQKSLKTAVRGHVKRGVPMLRGKGQKESGSDCQDGCLGKRRCSSSSVPGSSQSGGGECLATSESEGEKRRTHRVQGNGPEEIEDTAGNEEKRRGFNADGTLGWKKQKGAGRN